MERENGGFAEGKTRYETRQGKLILDYLASLGGEHITAGAAALHFEGRKQGMGKTTVYRHLEKLVESGMVRRYFIEGAESACYQYAGDRGDCREHFHLKCEDCGELFHLDCAMLSGIAGHVQKEHRFSINPLRTVFYGTCGRCLAKAKKRIRRHS